MDDFKKKTAPDYTAHDLNCRRYVEHTPRRNVLEQKIKRKARHIMKQDILTDFEEDDDDDDYPCNDCGWKDSCDGWEARFCCTLCRYMGGGDCDDCNPMDI